MNTVGIYTESLADHDGADMTKIFIVEDKTEVLEELKNSVDWEANGYELCGTAGDGELAFPLIRKLNPDIVITDDVMPFMDGISLSRLVKKEMPWIEIILLSDDENFEYAREGIRLGIAGYLLKPVNGQELLTELDTLAQRIRDVRQEREIIERYRKDKRRFLRELLTGSESTAELLEDARQLGVKLSALWYNIVLLTTQPLYTVNGGYTDYGRKGKELLKQWSVKNQGHLLVFDRDIDGAVLLFQADSREELENLQNECLNFFKVHLAEVEGTYYFGGIGSPVSRLRELPESFEKAGRAFSQRYFVRESMILDNKKLAVGTFAKKESIDIGSIRPKQLDRGKIREFLKIGSKEEVKSFVEEFLRDFSVGDMLKSDILRQYIILDVYFAVADFLEELQVGQDETTFPDMHSDVLQNEDGGVEKYLMDIIERALELREKAADNRYGEILDEVMRYIDENYADEELSLNLVASHVNFSSNHLSAVFSQHTGQTFIKYLTDIRMGKAKELLRCTGKKSSVISAEVGYKDPHYFSFLFKKTQGMTPTQFRRGKTTEDNA